MTCHPSTRSLEGRQARGKGCGQANCGWQAEAGRQQRRIDGGVLIIVLWVAFGLVTLALYFAHSMSFELRAADNRVAALEAEQAIEGTARYISNYLANFQYPGSVPDPQAYANEASKIGTATVWLIGRDTNYNQTGPENLSFGLVDEASKLNLNTATQLMLTNLPNMTSDLAAAIIDWRDSDDTVTTGGAESDTYARLNPPYRCKNAPFESVDELRLVYGMTLDVLYGEDVNFNGILDPNENDGDSSPPWDNRDGILNPGIAEYVTVFTQQSTNGMTSISNTQGLTTLFQTLLSSSDAQRYVGMISGGGGGQGQGGQGGQGLGGGGGVTISNMLTLYRTLVTQGGLSVDQFALLQTNISFGTSPVKGLVNINTASQAVLACIPGIGPDNAATAVSYRQANSDKLKTVGWLIDALGASVVDQAGPYVTTLSYQFSADIAAVGHHGRGYRRIRYVFDTSSGTPQIIYRRDLTSLGWGLGRALRNNIQMTKAMR